MASNYFSVNQTNTKRTAEDVAFHGTIISQEHSVSSSLSKAHINFNYAINTSRKRPRCNSSSSIGNEQQIEDCFCREPLVALCHLVTLSEGDDSSVDSLLDAVNTFLQNEEDEVDTMEGIESRLPAPDASNVDPDDYFLLLLHAMFPQLKVQVKSSVDLDEYFPTPTEAQMSKYTTEVVNVVRTNDANAMNEYYKIHGRAALDCCNRFGEGLLNMACRRGFTEMVKYLLSPAIQLNVRVRDDGGRTPLHDACWYPEPQLDVCTLIIQQDPSLFLVADKRGYTPFQYARKSDWAIWRQFLYANYKALHTFFATKPEVVQTFSCS
jgi:hypothetical protein